MAATIAGRLGLETGDAPIVDSDLHVYPAEADLVERLPERFRGKGVATPEGNWSSPVPDVREDATGEGSSGTSPERTRGAHLDALGIDYAVLTGGGPNLRASVLPDRRYAAALVSAYNDWLIEEWLDADDRLLGSISVASIAPEAAAEEIRRLGDHPDMVQVIMGSGTQIPLGQKRYWPIYEAAADAGLPVAIHAGTEGYGVANPTSGAGYASTEVERRSVIPATFMGQLLNLVLEGPFVEFPDLRVVMVGGGYGWVPSFLWRIDKMWKGVTDDFPWVERPPSEYVRERVRFATYPIDEPRDPDWLDGILEAMNAGETLMFASDYPRRESYAPGDPLPDLEPALGRAIFSETARELYGLASRSTPG